MEQKSLNALCLPSTLMSLEIKLMAVLKQFGILFVLGIAGIVMLAITSVPFVEQQLAKLSPEILANVPPLWVLILLQALQLTVLLAISILIGIGCAYRVGLRSHLIDYWVLHTPKIPFSVIDEMELRCGCSDDNHCSVDRSVDATCST
jgi:hypothetical protein